MLVSAIKGSVPPTAAVALAEGKMVDSKDVVPGVEVCNKMSDSGVGSDVVGGSYEHFHWLDCWIILHLENIC